MSLSYKLEVFEGPWDLLLHLIEKNKVNIYDIPIAQISDQYLEYMSSIEDKDLEVVSEFMVMAATLLDIKSRMLLPVEVDESGEEIDPREELVARLLEYKMYKCLADDLRVKFEDSQYYFYKEPTIPPEVAKYEIPVNIEELVEDLTLSRLQEIFQMVMRRQVDKIDPIRSKFGTIQRESIRLADRLAYIQQFASHDKRFSFKQLLQAQTTRTEVVVTFLAVLELMKIGVVSTSQHETFGDINMEWNSNAVMEWTQEQLAQYD